MAVKIGLSYLKCRSKQWLGSVGITVLNQITLAGGGR